MDNPQEKTMIKTGSLMVWYAESDNHIYDIWFITNIDERTNKNVIWYCIKHSRNPKPVLEYIEHKSLNEYIVKGTLRIIPPKK